MQQYNVLREVLPVAQDAIIFAKLRMLSIFAVFIC